MSIQSTAANGNSAGASKSVSQTNSKVTPIREKGWTLRKQAQFLRALSSMHCVTDAARSVGMSRQSAYRLRSKLKGKPFDLAWEVAFHHSYDVLAHTALERALNGVEMPVYFQGELVGTYRRFDERLTVALLKGATPAGNPVFGRLSNSAEKHARDFEALLGKLEKGVDVATGAFSVDDPGELEVAAAQLGANREERPSFPCPSTWSDDELMKALEGFDDE
ncbi:MAG: hypothetical protein AAGK17_02190 [Pseudomonadota bacterium]